MQQLLLAEPCCRSLADLRKSLTHSSSSTSSRVRRVRVFTSFRFRANHTCSERVELRRCSDRRRRRFSAWLDRARKNQLKLLDAFEEFSSTEQGAGWQLILAGNLREDISAKVNAAIQRNARVQYVANPSDDELDALYKDASFTVFPSIEEGFGLPILESLWYAKPCICADFGAMAKWRGMVVVALP